MKALTDEQRFALIGIVDKELKQYQQWYKVNNHEDLKNTWSQRISLLEGILTVLKTF